jgi:hypothetical protein
MADVEAFCFPAEVLHPRSGSRLLVLAESGPLRRVHSFHGCLCAACRARALELRASSPEVRAFVHGEPVAGEAAAATFPWLCAQCQAHCRDAVHIVGGARGRHVVSELELAEMEREVTRADIMEAYGRAHSLSLREQLEFISALPVHKRLPPAYSRPELRELLAPLRVAADGTVDFDELRALVSELRRRRVRALRKMHRDVVVPRPPPATYRASQLTRSLAAARVPDHQVFRVATRLLHSSAHLVAAHGKRVAADAVVANVRLLRQLAYDSETNWQGARLLSATSAYT